MLHGQLYRLIQFVEISRFSGDYDMGLIMVSAGPMSGKLAKGARSGGVR